MIVGISANKLLLKKTTGILLQLLSSPLKVAMPDSSQEAAIEAVAQRHGSSFGARRPQ